MLSVHVEAVERCNYVSNRCGLIADPGYGYLDPRQGPNLGQIWVEFLYLILCLFFMILSLSTPVSMLCVHLKAIIMYSKV